MQNITNNHPGTSIFDKQIIIIMNAHTSMKHRKVWFPIFHIFLIQRAI